MNLENLLNRETIGVVLMLVACWGLREWIYQVRRRCKLRRRQHENQSTGH